MASTKSISVPPILDLGNIVYSKNFGGNNLGIVIRNGITIYEDKKFDHAGGSVYYIDKNNKSVISSGSLETIEENIGSSLISMDRKMQVDDEFEENRHKTILSTKKVDYFRYILEHAEKDPIIRDNLLLAKDGIFSVASGRRHRRKSRRHKKPNHRHKKRRITQRYKK